MRCPFCHAEKERLKVLDSRSCDNERSVRRRRKCLSCSRRFTTYERVEEAVNLTVVKKDGRRVPWERNRILNGLQRACFKRPVPEAELARIVDEVEDEIYKTTDREVRSSLIGQLVTERLRKIDQVAYVRFASVYKRFKTLEELMEDAQAVLEGQHDDLPGQGHLFVAAPAVHATGVNSEGANGGVAPATPKPAKLAKKASDEASERAAEVG